jgi:hypothetical protein
MNGFEEKLLSQTSVANITDVLDVPAAIDYFIITEITKNPGACSAVAQRLSNIDAHKGSWYLWLSRNLPSVLWIAVVDPISLLPVAHCPGLRRSGST